VPQNFNSKAWEILSRLLGFDMARVILDSLPVCGHMISGDNLLNLRELLNSGRIEKGQKLLTFMAGYGSNWQTLILQRTST
jgi:3-oxoacyl-[acyl-carrier-protein] synthase III